MLIEPEARPISAPRNTTCSAAEAFGDWLAAQDLDIIGMRPLRDELRGITASGQVQCPQEANLSKRPSAKEAEATAAGEVDLNALKTAKMGD